MHGQVGGGGGGMWTSTDKAQGTDLSASGRTVGGLLPFFVAVDRSPRLQDTRRGALWGHQNPPPAALCTTASSGGHWKSAKALHRCKRGGAAVPSGGAVHPMSGWVLHLLPPHSHRAAK